MTEIFLISFEAALEVHEMLAVTEEKKRETDASDERTEPDNIDFWF